MTGSRSLLIYSSLCALSIRAVLSQCEASCSIRVNGYLYGWEEKSVSETITAATVVEIVNTDLGITRTETILNEEVKLPTNTNSDGTLTQEVTYTYTGEEFVTEIAYPTEFWEFQSEWPWDGSLPTTDADGSSTCMTEGTISFDYFAQPASITPPPKSAGSINDLGWDYEPMKYDMFEFPTTGPDNEDAWSSCTPMTGAPYAPAYGAAYVVQTSRSFESGTSTPTSSGTRRTLGSSGDKTDESVIVPTTMTVVSEGESGPTTLTVVSEVAVVPETGTGSGDATPTGNSAEALAIAKAKVLVGTIVGVLFWSQLFA